MNRKRAALLARLEAVVNDLAWAMAQFSPEQLNWEPAPGEWSAHAVLAHLRDVEEQVYGLRVRRILTEEHPALADFDEGAWHAEHYNPKEPIKRLLAKYRAARQKELALLRAAPESAWTRWGTHPAYGKVRLDWLAARIYVHALNHLVQILQIKEKLLLEEANRGE
jgi:hypothetical protein